MTNVQKLRQLIQNANDIKPNDFKELANEILNDKIVDRIDQERQCARTFNTASKE